MNSVTGVSPNAINVVTPNQDLANNRELRAPDQSRVFTPVEEAAESDRGRNRGNEQPARQAERDTYNIPAQSQQSAETAEPQADPATVQRADTAQPIEETATTTTAVDQTETRSTAADVDEVSDRAEQQAQARQVDEQRQQRELEQDQQLISDLKQRDREVKDHEQAHRAVGGKYAGAMSLSYERGPDGVNYAVAGEVQISLSRVANDPNATLSKAQQVRRAALAPAEPSPQDRAVAAQATQLVLDAQQEIRETQVSQEGEREEERSELSEVNEEQQQKAESSSSDDEQKDQLATESRQENLDELLQSTQEISEQLLELDNFEQKQKAVGANLDFVV